MRWNNSRTSHTLMDTTETQNTHHWSQTLLGMALVIMFAYYGESVLAVLFFAILLSFMLSPVVQALEYLHLPRAMAALVSVVVLLALLYGVTVASYNQAFPSIRRRSAPSFSPSSATRKSSRKLARRSEPQKTPMLCRCGRSRPGPRPSLTEPALLPTSCWRHPLSRSWPTSC